MRHGNGLDYALRAWVHDEIQIGCDPALAEHIRDIAIAQTSIAGGLFNFNCRLDGEGKIGINWKECH